MTTTETKKRPFVKAIGAMTLAAAMVLLPTVAHAEGSWSSNITQGRPSFQSRTWEDRNTDNASTTVTFGGCKANNGGQAAGTLSITSITLTLYTPNGAVSSRTRGSCGTFSWGDMPNGRYWFKITSINGRQAPDRVFLNVNSVRVNY